MTSDKNKIHINPHKSEDLKKKNRYKEKKRQDNTLENFKLELFLLIKRYYKQIHYKRS